jgi:hypothetical protein
VKLIARKSGLQDKYDRLRCIREDGSTTEVEMPRQGKLPHDLVHAVIESRLGFEDGFIGLVAKGAEMAFAAEAFHAYIDPVRHAEVAQAESIVESLQAQLWSGRFDREAFDYGVRTACAMRDVETPDFSGLDPESDLFDPVVAMAQVWAAIPAHSEWSLVFPLDTTAMSR